MATTDYRLAAPLPILMRFEDDTGAPITDMDFQIRISMAGACVVVNGVLNGDMFAFDLSGLSLVPRPYKVTVYSNDGTGWAFNQQLNLNVIGGC